MSPGHAQVTAALDGAYYALLEHALCCGWAAPAVPPPHAWFPAFTAAHPGPTMRCSLESAQKGQDDLFALLT